MGVLEIDYSTDTDRKEKMMSDDMDVVNLNGFSQIMYSITNNELVEDKYHF